MNSELSVAAGVAHVTMADVVPRSAVLRIFEGQFEKVGPETSLVKKNQREEISRSRKIKFSTEEKETTVMNCPT